MIEYIIEYWWAILGILIFIVLNYKNKMNNLDIRSDVTEHSLTHKGFTVQFPKKIDFDGARITVVSGFKNLTQYADINTGHAYWDLPNDTPIDKVKIRTKGGKEYNYDQQYVPSLLVVDPIPCYECDLNPWRK
tara:strand:+ start:3113 stop:3511 length:399 start_codon:yes stop_codon:yes gene_type:complete